MSTPRHSRDGARDQPGGPTATVDERLGEGIRRLPGLPAARRAAMRAELDALAAELLPPPPAPPAWPRPPAAAVAAGLAVIGVVAWTLAVVLSARRDAASVATPRVTEAAGVTNPGAGGADAAGSSMAAALRTPTPAAPGPGTSAAATSTLPRRSLTPARAAPATPAPLTGAGPSPPTAPRRRPSTPGPTAPPTHDPNDFDRPPPGGGAYPGPPGPGDEGTVSGRVTDNAGQPLAGAKVTLFSIAGGSSSAEQLTDGDGRFAILAAPGVYDARAEAAGYTEQWFDGKASREAADQIVVEPRGSRDGVMFTLAPLPSPVPPGYPGPP